VQVYVLEAESSSTDANRLCGMLVIKVILCGRDTKSKLKGHICHVSNRTCIEKLETGLFIKVEWPHVAGSRKCHARGPRLKACVTHAAILRGKYHNHTWPTQKMPRVCEVISGLYCIKAALYKK